MPRTEAETANGGDIPPNPPASASQSSTSFGPNVRISTHPVLSHKISVLRSSSTRPAEFRSVLREITFHLGYEATSTSLTVREVPLSVPVPKGKRKSGDGLLDHEDVTGYKISERISLIPILRSGLGMTEAMLELLPSAGVHHIGMYRKDLVPVMYYNRLPRKCDSDVAYVLDPVVATGSTMMSVVGLLKKVSLYRFKVFVCDEISPPRDPLPVLPFPAGPSV